MPTGPSCSLYTWRAETKPALARVPKPPESDEELSPPEGEGELSGVDNSDDNDEGGDESVDEVSDDVDGDQAAPLMRGGGVEGCAVGFTGVCGSVVDMVVEFAGR